MLTRGCCQAHQGSQKPGPAVALPLQQRNGCLPQHRERPLQDLSSRVQVEQLRRTRSYSTAEMPAADSATTTSTQKIEQFLSLCCSAPPVLHAITIAGGTHPLREHSTDPHPCCALEVAQAHIFRLCLPRGWLCAACLGSCCLKAMLAMLCQLSTLTLDVPMFP